MIILHIVENQPMAIYNDETWAVFWNWDYNEFTKQWQACYFVRDDIHGGWYSQTTGEQLFEGDFILGESVDFSVVKKHWKHSQEIYTNPE